MYIILYILNIFIKFVEKNMIEEFFNVDLYIKIRQKRKEIGLPIFDDLYPDNGRIYDHQLEGKKLIWKSNCILTRMDILQVDISDSDKKVIKFEKKNLTDFVKYMKK